jgi:hypothetical protein
MGCLQAIHTLGGVGGGSSSLHGNGTA